MAQQTDPTPLIQAHRRALRRKAAEHARHHKPPFSTPEHGPGVAPNAYYDALKGSGKGDAHAQ